MVNADIVLDPSGMYRVSQGFSAVETDRDVLSLTDLHLIWARGRRAAEAVRILTKERDLEYLEVIDPSAWLAIVRLPECVIESERRAIIPFLADSPPADEGEARDRVRQWIASSRYAALPRLLEDPDQLMSVVSEAALGVLERDLLVWLANARRDLTHSSLVVTLVAAADPVAEWFGLSEPAGSEWITRAAGFLPTRLPASVVTRLQEHWQRALIAGAFDVAAQAIAAGVPAAIGMCIKRVAREVYDRRPPNQQAVLAPACRTIFGPAWRPPKPANMRWTSLAGTETLPECLDWFRKYRAEVSWREPMAPERIKAAQSFRSWYLGRDQLPRWAAQGEVSPLSFRVNSLIRDAQHNHAATLVVIVDGLGHEEHLRLVSEIGQRTTTLHVHVDDPILAVLPTVTPICKGALLSGRPQREWPSSAPDYPKMVRDCARVGFRGRWLDAWSADRVAESLTDTDTSLVVVNHIELDYALHSARTGQEAQSRAESAIIFVASEVASVAEEVGAELESLAVVLCSDHGQVVGPCRPEPAPEGTVKQRVRLAHGERRAHEVELRQAVSLCTDDYLLLDDDTAWSSGAGQVFGCHGSAFPEEVVTRVTLLSSTPTIPRVRVTGQGSGVAGVEGQVSWTVMNQSRVELSVTKATLRFGSQAVYLEPLATQIPSNSQRVAPQQRVSNWPTADEAHEARIELEYFIAGKDVPLRIEGPVVLDIALGYESTPFSL